MTQPSFFLSTSPRPRRRFLASLGWLALSLSVGLSLTTTGCGQSMRLVAQRPELMTPGALRIVLLEVDDNMITVDVFNQTNTVMLIYRDAVLLSTSGGLRARMPGGVGHVYTVPPGGMHKLRVRYDLHGLHRGDQVAMVFQNAIVIAGQPVPVEPLPFVLQ